MVGLGLEFVLNILLVPPPLLLPPPLLGLLDPAPPALPCLCTGEAGPPPLLSALSIVA